MLQNHGIDRPWAISDRHVWSYPKSQFYSCTLHCQAHSRNSSFYVLICLNKRVPLGFHQRHWPWQIESFRAFCVCVLSCGMEQLRPSLRKFSSNLSGHILVVPWTRALVRTASKLSRKSTSGEIHFFPAVVGRRLQAHTLAREKRTTRPGNSHRGGSNELEAIDENRWWLQSTTRWAMDSRISRKTEKLVYSAQRTKIVSGVVRFLCTRTPEGNRYHLSLCLLERFPSFRVRYDRV